MGNNKIIDKKPVNSSAVLAINDKEWKRAVFKRWDEFKVLRRDVILRLNETVSSIPEDISSAEKRISELKNAEDKLKKILLEIEALDDSSWDRHNLSSELASGMRKVENSRMDCMLISAKCNDTPIATVQNAQGISSSSIINEIQSLTFSQGFKLGLGLFFPLITGIIIAALILAIFNYLSLM